MIEAFLTGVMEMDADRLTETANCNLRVLNGGFVTPLGFPFDSMVSLVGRYQS